MTESKTQAPKLKKDDSRQGENDVDYIEYFCRIGDPWSHFAQGDAGVSALAIFWPPIPRAGRILMAKTRIPMPPNHWQKERQNKIPFGRISTSVTMEAPVVVNPDTASKKALINPSMVPVVRYGRQPMRKPKASLRPRQDNLPEA